MDSQELKKRTKNFVLLVLKMVNGLPKTLEAEIFKKQLIRSASSVGANYRSACRARSQADFISKITVMEEEADESAYWTELITESGILNNENTKAVLKEANELTAIFTASGNTAKKNKQLSN